MTSAEQALSDGIDALVAAIAKEDTLIASIITYVQGVPAIVQAAVDAALAAGETTATGMATVVSGALADVQARADEIAAAVPQNTPAATP
jgi:hypothetical protein